MKSNLNNQNFKLKLQLMFVLLIFFQTNIRGQFLPEFFSQKKSGEIIKSRLNGSFPKFIDTVSDDKLSTMISNSSWRSDFKHKSVINRITLSVKDTSVKMQKFDYIFDLTIDTFDSQNRRGSFNLLMRLSYDPTSHQSYIDKVVYQFSNSHKFIVKINEIIDSSVISPGIISPDDLQTNFNLESEIIVERYYLGSYSTPVNSTTHSYIGKDKLFISWVPPTYSSPNRYELEWAYIDTSGVKFDSLKYDFSHNSSRVNITKTNYTINLVYDAGVLIYRVRRVKPDSVFFKYDKYSTWYPDLPKKGFVKDYSSSNKLFINSHEGMGKNWDYQVAFAEEGLKKEVVNYFDGSLKRRQGVTLLNTNNFVLVDESIYDNHGREAIKIIPAPSDSSTIRYYQNFNQNEAGFHYSARDFDTSTTGADKCNGNYTAKPLGTQSGAGRYYSSSNQDKTNENAAIPDAFGYPLVQTQLMPDPTGRVFAQGGVGKSHQLGSGHETKYTYGTANQIELDELFGSEVGIANHYKKNAVIDPNGQVSISYIDQHGRVIATSLTGGVPGMVDSLENFNHSVFKMVDLINNEINVKNALVTNYNFSAISSGEHKIYYKLEAPAYKFGCLGLDVCYSCQYDLTVALFDDCFNEIFSFKRNIGSIEDNNCMPYQFNLKDSIASFIGASANGDSISFYLNAGTYHLTKILTVNLDSIDHKINKIIQSDSTCFKNFDLFFNDEVSKIDFSDCYCDTCSMDSLTFCESRKLLMLEDLSPDGQYFKYDEGNYNVTDVTSVLRTVSGQPLFHTLNSSLFKDENGKIDTLWLDEVNFNLPNELTVEEFISNWKESWAEALISLHPEYCYYKYCIDSLDNTYRYDEGMMSIDNYDSAVSFGYFDPLNFRTDYNISNPDPFFVKTDGSLKSAGILLKQKLENLSVYNIGASQDPLLIQVPTTDIWQLSKSIGFCENIKDSFQRQSCFKFYYSNNVTNNWMNDKVGRDNYWAKFKSMYFQIKQRFIEERMNEKVSGSYCVKKIGVNSCSNENYKSKISHFIRYQSNNPLENQIDSISLVKNNLIDTFSMNSSCEINLIHWDESLKLCNNYNLYRDSILFHFLDICKSSNLNLNELSAFGSKDVPSSLLSNYRFKNFEEVLEYFIGNNYKNSLCNIDLINSPKFLNNDFNNSKPKETNDCICNKLKDEIGKFKGCNSRKDSLELSTEGLLVNDFVNGIVKYNLLNLGNNVRRLDSCSDLINVVNKLFIPVLGGTTSSILIKEKVQTQYLNEKTFTVYNTNYSNGCSFTFRLLNNTGTFSNIDLNYKSTIKPYSQGVFIYQFRYTGGAIGVAYVYTTCFNNIGKCSPHLSASDIDKFTIYFNNRFNSSINNYEIEQLVAQCGTASFPNTITDKLNTYFMQYGTCPDYYQGYKEPKDLNLINTLNQMMRSPSYHLSKRYLTTDEKNFNCNTADFLTLTNDYHLYKPYAGNKYDNYWWVEPKFELLGPFTFVDSGISISRYDTVWTNNLNKDPYFVGGFWIGARCADIKDSVCFTSFGDPFKQLGVGSNPTLSQIDSLSYMRWDYILGSFIVSAWDRSSPSDSVILTIKNQCKAECNPLTRTTEIPINYKDVFIKPGSGGAMYFKQAKASLGYRSENINPFLDMINGLAKYSLLDYNFDIDIRIFKKNKNNQNNYFKQINPVSDSFNFSLDYFNDSVYVGKLGKSSNYCKFGFKKSGSNRNFDFNDIDVFKNIEKDDQAIAEAISNDQIEMANYHFTIKAGNINSPGDTTWYDLRGWSSCWKFSEITLVSADGNALFNLPDEFSGNCNCLTCPESKRWSDSLYTEYPTLYPEHSNYPTIVENYINRKLNTNLSFIEIQSVWDACEIGKRTMFKKAICDYRLAIKNTECEDYADSTLYNIMVNTGLIFNVESYKTADSTIYLMSFDGFSNQDIVQIKDSIAKYFSYPYCNSFNHFLNYRDSFDLMLFNMNGDSLNSSVFDTWFSNIKTNYLSGANITNVSVNDVQYRSTIENNWSVLNTNWYSQMNIQSLDFTKRKLFLDTLENWINTKTGIILKTNFYIPQLNTPDNRTLCLSPITSGSDICYTCDTFKQRLINYQYDIASKRKNPSSAMKSDSIGIYLSNALGRKLEVKNSTSDCENCENENMFICQTPSERVDSIVSLLNRIAYLKKMNSNQFLLTGTVFTNLLNVIKPIDVILNAPKYSIQSNNYGGWAIVLKYNSYQYDVIQVEDLLDDTMVKFVNGITVFKNLNVIPMNGISNRFSLTAVDSLYGYRNIEFSMIGLVANKCCQIPNTMLCPKSTTRDFEIIEPPCNEIEIQQAFVNAIVRHKEYIDSLKRELRASYHNHCFSNVNQDFKIGVYKQRYHSTLYYYDQAGNLTKTVPPLGVNELDVVLSEDSILNYRNDISNDDKFVNTYHHLATNYKYNSLNQLVWQKTPDGGVSRFWYDRLGRLLLSQNSVQAAQSNESQKLYSYTRYDFLGRIIEVGQIVNEAIDSVQIIEDLSYFNLWLGESIARSQITKTFYDFAVMESALNEFEEGQRNLRGRVSCIAYYDYYTTDSTNYSRASHFSYDIHGNVDHLIQDFPELQEVNQRFKQFVYNYDLISGKVHSVSYQEGKPDQWFHRYQYDADNRLLIAETSRDKVIWDKDAEYKYYKHGPLSRTILGEHAVQGVDYAYTLHGWLKGVNSNTLNAGRDIGKDGFGALKEHTAKDAFGFTLGYFTDNSSTSFFDGDYSSIGETQFEANTENSPLSNSNSNLYNGNISHMVTAVGVLLNRNSGSPVATAYRYDQLNRIKTVQSYNGIDMSGNSWNTGSLQTAWKESFKYDANGNITNLKRYSETGLMDDLTYTYKPNTNQLTHVNDQVDNLDFNVDIDDQDVNNYHYDQIGN